MSRKLQNVLIGASLLLLIIILNLPFTNQSTSEIVFSPQPTKDSIDPYLDQITAFQEDLVRNDLSEEERTLLTAKLNTISIMATQRVERLTAQPPKETIQAMPTVFVEAGMKIPDGIDPNPDVPIPIGKVFVTTLTSWKKTTEERTYFIFSGYSLTAPQQGVLMVQNPQTFFFKRYDTPEKTGGVSVIAENGLIITLQAETGALYYFDAAQEWFVDATGVPLPTYTPSPTPVLTLTPAPMYPAP